MTIKFHAFEAASMYDNYLNSLGGLKIPEPKLKQCTACGKMKPVLEYNLHNKRRSRTYRRTFCKTCELEKANFRKRHQNYVGNLLYGAKMRALDKGLEFNLDSDDIVVPETCPLMGIPIHQGNGKLHKHSPSLDRIDNTKGYIKGNV